MYWRGRAVFNVRVSSSLIITTNASDFYYIYIYIYICVSVHVSTTGGRSQGVEMYKTEITVATPAVGRRTSTSA